MFVVSGNLWESHCQKLDPFYVVGDICFISLAVSLMAWCGFGSFLSLSVTRNIYNSLDSVPCYSVGVCVRTPKPNGKSQILEGWGAKRSSTGIFKAFIEDVSPHTEMPDLKPILTVL